jgi:hypothetical protein
MCVAYKWSNVARVHVTRYDHNQSHPLNEKKRKEKETDFAFRQR